MDEPPQPDLTGRQTGGRPPASTPNLAGANDRRRARGQVGAARDRRVSVQHRESANVAPVAAEEQLWALPEAPPAPVDGPAVTEPQGVPAAHLPGAVEHR